MTSKLENIKRIARDSPHPGERAAAEAALRKIEAREARKPKPETWQINWTVGYQLHVTVDDLTIRMTTT